MLTTQVLVTRAEGEEGGASAKVEGSIS